MKKSSILIIILLVFNFQFFAQKLVILHTNDMHSKLTGFGPEASYTPLVDDDDKTLGGFARLATVVNEEKAKNGDAVIVCDAGDFLMGTIFQSLEPESGFQLNLMKSIGYDVITLGNHEFDFGPQNIANVINNAIKIGGIPQIVSSELIFSDTDKRDDDLQKLYAENYIKPYTVIERNGLKIGFFGLLGEEAQMVTQAAVPVQFKDVVKTAKSITKILREDEKVDIIICLSHSGVYADDEGVMYGEDIDLAKKVSDIDIIISGHTHVPTYKYIQQGKTIIVQTGSYLKNLGRLEINYENGTVSVTDFHLIKMNDDIKGDEKVNQAIEQYKKKVDEKFFSPYNLSYSKPVCETNFDLVQGYFKEKKPSSIGNLITDAIRYYVDNFSTGTDIVLEAQGTIRESFLTGEITPADIFRVTPLGFGNNDLLGYSLAKVYIYGREIKKLGELSIFAGKPGEDSYLYYNGVEFTYNPKGGFLNKVVKIELNGKEIDFSKKNKTLYSLTANRYLLGFVEEVKKMSHGLVKIYPKDSEGNHITNIDDFILDFDKNKDGVQEGKEWLAIIEFMRQFEDSDKDGLPEIPENYKTFKNPFVVK
ncbi:MAG: bifunctional metallophosphatase/5'-nucleotidase [Bacteroidales bacterium]|nr:bifunctional metallophosphatase/5'-nucleotidase [Bacteroidales bacterium]